MPRSILKTCRIYAEGKYELCVQTRNQKNWENKLASEGEARVISIERMEPRSEEMKRERTDFDGRQTDT